MLLNKEVFTSYKQSEERTGEAGSCLVALLTRHMAYLIWNSEISKPSGKAGRALMCRGKSGPRVLASKAQARPKLRTPLNITNCKKLYRSTYYWCV